jgi:predicted aminopeptidase
MKILGILIFLFFYGCSGFSYISENGIEQWKLFNRSRPVKDVLASSKTTEETRSAIRLVSEAKQFAVELGLKATANYENFVKLEGPCLLWAVSSAHSLELKEKMWKFPLVGEVPYLGFFKKNSADQEAARIKTLDTPSPDVWVRCVPAYSSLGWFADPLYSSMLKGKERDVVELVLHESLHATVWVGNSVDFNEKLASFVGLEGSLRFLAQKRNEEALKEAKREVAGEKAFGDFLFQEKNNYLQNVKTMNQKQKFYAELPLRYKKFVRAFSEEKVKSLEVKFEGWNNAALLTYANYYSDFSVFEAILQSCEGSLGRFVNWISQEQEKGEGRFLGAPEEHLAELVKGSSCPPSAAGGSR